MQKENQGTAGGLYRLGLELWTQGLTECRMLFWGGNCLIPSQSKTLPLEALTRKVEVIAW
jgi:hypothetical protein